MRGLPDSAVVGTYKRMKRVGKPRRVRKSHKSEAEFLFQMIDALQGWANNYNARHAKKG